MEIRLDEGPVWTWKGRIRRPLGFRWKGDRKQVGRWGEWLALRHLQRLRWDVIARNWRSRRGELDLIAYHGGEIVFVEVRTRVAPTDIRPEETVDSAKQEKLQEVAWDFVRHHDMMDALYRFDLVAIETADLREFELRHYHL